MDDAGGFGAVVASEDDQRIVGHTKFIERSQEFPDDAIEFMDEIAVRTGFGLALELVRGERRQMNRLRGVVEEERFARRAADVRFEKLAALLQEYEVDVFHREIRGDDASPAVVGVRMLGQRLLVDLACWRNRHAVAVDERVEPVRRGTARSTEEAVEAVVNRPPFDAAREVHSLDRFHAVAADRLAILVEERQSDVPLADARCGIAFGAEHCRQRESPGAMSDGPPTPVKTNPPRGTRKAICPVIRL